MKTQKLFWTGLVSLICLSPALAASRSQGPPEIEWSPPWVAILYTIVFLVGICVVAFKNAKRTHLD